MEIHKTEQIKKNLIAKEKIEQDSDFPQKMRDIKPSVLASLFNTYGGGCINDGSWISEPTMKFYGYSVEKFLCFDCQKQERLENIEDQEMKWGEREAEEYGEMVYSKKQNEEVLFEYNLK